MTPPCSMLESLSRWACGGEGSPLGGELAGHLAECDECSSEHAAILSVRRRLAALPVRPVAPARLDAIRFELLAAARSSADRGAAPEAAAPPARPSPRKRAAAAAVGAAVLLAAVLAFATVGASGDPEPASPRPAASPQAPANVPEPQVAGAAPAESTEAIAPGGQAPDPRLGDPPTPAIEPRPIAPAPTRRGGAALSPLEIASPARPPGRLAVLAASAKPAARAVDPGAEFDRRFQGALAELHAGRPAVAAKLFDALCADPAADAGRRADALYWAAHAHAAAGEAVDAQERARALTAIPGSWHGDDAALLMGESLMREGDAAGARPWLERAARSPKEATRARARQALEPAAAPR